MGPSVWGGYRLRRLPCRRRAALLIGLLLAHTACYSYKPVATAPSFSSSDSGTAEVQGSPVAPDLQQGQRIRVHLSTPGDYALTDVVPRNVTSIDGELIRWTEDELVLSAWWMKTTAGQEFQGRGESVAVPGTDIGVVEKRALSVGKTAGIAVLIGGAIVALGVVFGGSSAEGGNGGTPIPPE